MYKLPFNLKEWIQENKAFLKPPVCNKVIYIDTEFIVMVVGGPNKRKDYHVDVGEEFFFQIKGDMVLNLMDSGHFKEIKIKEGEIFLLPPMIPHSPQRFIDTVGLVIERKRKPNELDGFQWYCDKCHNLLYETFIQLNDIVKQLPPLFETFWSNEEKRTCSNCNTYLQK